MTKQLKCAALLAATVFAVQGWARAEEPAVVDTSEAEAAAAAAADDSAQAGEAAVAEDNQDAATDPAASDTARPAAARSGKAARGGGAAAHAEHAEHGSMDEQFVKHAASGGMLEVATAKLAVERAQSQEVKQYAQRIIRDHQKANQQLMQLAKAKNIQLDKQMMPMHQTMLEHLQQKQGEKFEKAYVYHDLSHHVMDVLEFRDASQELQDEDLKSFAAQQLPILQEHLAMAGQLANWDQATTAGATERGTGATGGTETVTPPPGGARQKPGAKAGQPSKTGAGGTGDETTETGNEDAEGSGASPGPAGASDSGTPDGDTGGEEGGGKQ